MSPELEKAIFDKHTTLFKGDDLPYGFECGDGWFHLINQLCGFLNHHLKHNQIRHIKVVQVKEKFGGLRFYTYGGDDLSRGAIWFAESLSNTICEDCGAQGKKNSEGWIVTLCDECRAKREAQNGRANQEA